MAWREPRLPVHGGGVLGTDFFYYNNGDAATYGLDGTYKCGLLYTGNACKYIIDNNLVPGWHVPSIDELHDLMENAYGMLGFKNIASKAESWSLTWTGRDYFGFNLKPAGYYNVGSGYIGFGESIRLHSKTYNGSNNHRLYLKMSDGTIQWTPQESSPYLSFIRLVKDY